MLNLIERKSALGDLPERGYSEAENTAMQRAVLNLVALWDLTNEETSVLLGGISTKTLGRWRRGEYGRLSIDQSDRISHLLGIHKALRIIFQDKARVYGWIKTPNDVFHGKSALEIMLGGHFTDISRVRHYLDSVRGGW